MSGIRAGKEWKVVEGVDILAWQPEWLGQLAQLEEFKFEETYPHSHSLSFLIFPEVIAQMLAHKGFHHSSPLLHKIAIESFKSHYRVFKVAGVPGQDSRVEGL